MGCTSSKKNNQTEKPKLSRFNILFSGCGSSNKKTLPSNTTNQANSRTNKEEEFERIKAENERLQQDNVKLGNQSNT